MKIGIITLSCAHNYGAILQTYALYSTLKKWGHDAFVIDYIPKRYQIGRDGYAKAYLEKTIFWKKNVVLKFIWKHSRYKDMKKNMYTFRKFLNENVPCSKQYYSYKELRENPPKADLYVTGSDQVWNSDFLWDEKIDLPFYLAFVKGKKISYASSFGKKELDNSEKSLIFNELKQYAHISAREKSGVEIVKDLGFDAVEVVDPTLLYGRNGFKEMAVTDFVVHNPYILVFQITYDKNFVNLAERISKENKKKLIVILPRREDRHKVHYHAVVLPSVKEWISYFMNASYIMTDSFHATIFSIMFHKEFTVNMAAGYSGRLDNILAHVGIENRKIEEMDYQTFRQQYYTPIDYSNVSRNVESWVKESEVWLQNALAK